MEIADLRVPISDLPQVDTGSWLSGLADTITGGMDRYSARRDAQDAFEQMQGAPQTQQSGGFVSRLLGGGQQAPQPPKSQNYTAPVMPVDRGPMQGETYKPFMDTVRAGGVSNPYALAAIAATGRAESGWSAANANRTWSDPSQSGQPGTAGGIMSWRGPRYQALASTGDLSPEGQARFFLQENPQLIASLNNAKSPEEAADLMANAWRFAGYNQQGGEAARRRAMARNYYAQEFGRAPNGAADAIEAVAPAGGFDAGRFAADAAQAQGREQLAAALQQTPTDDIQTASTAAPPAGSNVLAEGITPVRRGSVDPALLARLVTNPQSRELGIALWKQNAGQATGEPWQFVTLPDGTLARANQQTGSVERVGNFAKPQTDKPPQLVELFDERTGQPYKARYNPQTMEYERVGGMKAPTGMQITTNPDGTVSVTQGAQTSNPKLTEQQSKDLVYYRRGAGALETLDPIADNLTSLPGSFADKVPGGNYLKSSDFQRAQQAGLEFLQAILRKDTGAAITRQEQDEYGKVYLPQPGDSAQVLLQKKQARARALEAIRKGLGPADILAGERPKDASSGEEDPLGIR